MNKKQLVKRTYKKTHTQKKPKQNGQKLSPKWTSSWEGAQHEDAIPLHTHRATNAEKPDDQAPARITLPAGT